MHHQHRLGHGARGQRQAARLLGDERRDPCVHQVAGQEPARQGDSRQCGGARTGLDAAEPGRQGCRVYPEVWRLYRYEAPGAARGTIARLCVLGLAGVRQLYHRHRAAGDGQRGRLKAKKTAPIRFLFPSGSRNMQRTRNP